MFSGKQVLGKCGLPLGGGQVLDAQNGHQLTKRDYGVEVALWV
jgi:hypothetical protein